MVTFGDGAPGAGVLPGLERDGVAGAERWSRRDGDGGTVSSGWPEIDGLLPGGGVRRGSLIEWFAGDAAATDAACGTGAATLACAVACRLAVRSGHGRERRGGLIVVIDRAGWFHPPAVVPWLGAAAGAAGRLVVARPARDDDEIWAIEQALRCAGVAAVVAWPRLAAAWSLERGVAADRRLAGRGGLQQWTTAMRRWQLAARSGAAVGLFVRSPAAAREPSWAESRLAVTALPGGSLLERRLQVTRVGGAWCAAGARPVTIAIDLARGRAAAPPRHDDIVERGASCRAS